MVNTYPAKLGVRGEYLRGAVREIKTVYDVMRASPRRMSAEQLHARRDGMTRFLTLYKHWGGHMVYKHHAAWHLA